jgi:hypothetical protein
MRCEFEYRIKKKSPTRVSRSFRTESITKYTLTTINTCWEATQRVMMAKLTRLTHKIAIQPQLVAESCTIWVVASGGQSGNYWIHHRRLVRVVKYMGLRWVSRGACIILIGVGGGDLSVNTLLLDWEEDDLMAVSCMDLLGGGGGVLIMVSLVDMGIVWTEPPRSVQFVS